MGVLVRVAVGSGLGVLVGLESETGGRVGGLEVAVRVGLAHAARLLAISKTPVPHIANSLEVAPHAIVTSESITLIRSRYHRRRRQTREGLIPQP